MKTIKLIAVLAGLLLTSASANAFQIRFDITFGVVCQFVGPCQTSADAFFDPAASFVADIRPDGTFEFSDPFTLSFDGGSQFIEFSVDGGVLTPEQGNPPVMGGVIPTGLWDGTFNYLTSTGVQGAVVITPNSGQTFFIDNEDDRFDFGLLSSNGDTNINFLVSGFVSIEPIPIPAAAWLFVTALASLGVLRQRAK